MPEYLELMAKHQQPPLSLTLSLTSHRGRKTHQEATLKPLEKKLAALSKAVQRKTKEVSGLDELFADSSQRTYENSGARLLHLVNTILDR